MARLFTGRAVNKIDRKSRVSVPAPFRAAVAGLSFPGIVAIPHFNRPALLCAGINWLEELAARIDAYDLFSAENDALTAAFFGSAQQLAFDPEGRITLPDELMTFAGLAENASFVGRGATFEIWEPAAFTSASASALRYLAENKVTLPGRSGGGGEPR
ncbi:MAG: division/cell wall cluster transcriptional repressor MraZ [Alphaproteobacteria bacterium]|nr:division/cell wall cluster transcriptional repressor MraZ [Alphaproteobacteria bacterium]